MKLKKVGVLKLNQQFTTNDKIASVSLFGLGALEFSRGLYWLIYQRAVLIESEFYAALHEVMPIWIWGLILAIFGLMIMLSSVFYGKRDVNKKSSYFMMIGGFGASIIQFLMVAASLYNSINILSPVQFTILTGWLILVSFLGGVDIYGKR